MSAKPEIQNWATDIRNDFQFSDIFNLEDIQRLQDLFSDSFGVASIITHPDGSPITNISNFCRLCNDIIRKTEKGRANCYQSDAIIGRQNPSGPVVQLCLSGGLWDAGASITVGGKHIANWLIGQVRNEEVDEPRMLQYADEIGVNKEEFRKALNEVTVMSLEQFDKTAKMLFAFANELSEKAYNNLQLKMQITERKLAEASLKQALEWQEAIFEGSLDAIFISDQYSHFVAVNNAACDLTGYSRNQLLKMRIPDIHDLPDLEAYKMYHKRIFGGEEILSEAKILRIDGAKTDTEFNNKCVSIAGKLYMHTTARDITKRKQAEEMVRNEQLLLRTLIDNLPDLIYCKDLDCCKTLANLAEVHNSGAKSEDEVLGKDDFEFYPKDIAERFFADDQLVMQTGIPVLNREEYIFDENGHIRWLLTSKLPLRDKDNRIIGLVGIGHDITGRKQADEEIKLKNEELIKIAAEKDKFFSIIAHDLRSPFNGFLGLTQIMTEELPGLTKAEMQELGICMRNSATNLFRLLENLLQWARMKQGIIPFDPEPVQLLPIVNESITMELESAENKRIEIICDIPGNFDVFADRNMLQSIMQNLVSNAVKFTHKGGKVSISAKTTDDKSVEISVKDSGIGMSREMIDNLFRSDVQTSRKGTEGESSTGLGLLLCKEFIEKHGGKIRVESVPESVSGVKGSVFYIIIPDNPAV